MGYALARSHCLLEGDCRDEIHRLERGYTSWRCIRALSFLVNGIIHVIS